MAIKGLVFDFDGLILDTETPDYEIWDQIYRSYGTHLPFDYWAAFAGRAAGSFDPVGTLQQRTGLNLDKSAVIRRKRELFADHIQFQPPRPGVVDYLDSARRLGLRIGLASSSDLPWVSGHLRRLGLMQRFEVVCTVEEVEQGKPDPALYRLAAQRLGLQPLDVLAFEDTPNGVTAAKAAGCHVVAVPNDVTRLLDLSHAGMVISSMADMPLETLLERFNGHIPGAVQH